MSALPNLFVSVLVAGTAGSIWILADAATRSRTRIVVVAKAIALAPAARSKRNREARKARGACIDEPDRGPAHGEVWRGGRCETCWRKSR